MTERTESTQQAIDRAGGLLADLPAGPLDAVAGLRDVRAAVDQALDEEMARATLEGHSVRAVAEQAGLAPNSVAPRLARTALLASYASDARVTAAGIERARYDTEQGRPAPPAAAPAPMRFRRRTSS